MSIRILFAALLTPLLLLQCGPRESGENTKTPDSESGTVTLFNLLSPQATGVNFTNTITEDQNQNYFTYNYFYNGGGVAIGDINNDGLPDLYFSSNQQANRLYLNKGGLKFQDITSQARVDGGQGWCTGVTMADVNADGLLDIYLCKSSKFDTSRTANLLYLNNGDLSFTESGAKYGLRDVGFSTMASFFDYDKDGDLDMYLMNHPIDFFYGLEDLVNNKDFRNPETSDKLFRNNGNSTFSNVSEAAGLLPDPFGYGLGLVTADLNGDDWPDIYVSNDFMPRDYFYLNNKDGTFTESLLKSFKHVSNFGMGADAADFNNDGLPDLFQADMSSEDHFRQKTNMSGMNPELFEMALGHGFHYQYMHNCLQINRGEGDFSEIAYLSGVSATDWSWAPLFMDLDNDGWKDLFVTNGYKRDMRNNDARMERRKYVEAGGRTENPILELNKIPSVKLPNYALRNNHDLTFTNLAKDWGLDHLVNSNGAAYADLDGDGDLDLVLNNIDEPASIYENTSDPGINNFLRIQLKGPSKNPFGIGTKAVLTTSTGLQSLELANARGYASSSEPLLHFGMGTEKSGSLKLTWPDGKIQEISAVQAGQVLTLDYKNSEPTGQADSPSPGMFSALKKGKDINFTHKENPFNDFARESLLPHKLSTLGPAIAIADINGDGLEDCFIGGAANQSAAVFLQDGSGKFRLLPNPAWKKAAMSEDIGALFFDADQDGDADLYVCSGGNDFDQNASEYQDRIYINDGKGQLTLNQEAIPAMLTSSSCATAADFDKDGDMDLFVGGRLIPGKYPYPCRSYLMVNENGKFRDATQEIAPDLLSPGMVTAATWTDYDADGAPDLILAGEWMPISLFRNENGKLKKASQPNGLEKSTGLWNCLLSVDYDTDGDMDFVAGNLGLNSKYKASKEAPFEIFCDDFDENGSLDIVLGTYEHGALYPVRGRECSSNQMPFIKDKFPTYAQFANASLMEVIGEQSGKNTLHYQAQVLSTSLIENKGNGQFAIHSLPLEAQFSPIFGIQSRDLDQDGKPDLILSGNFYAPEVETGRYDAGRGLVLMGNGKGDFGPLSPMESGFRLEGDVRGLAAIALGKEKIYGLIAPINNDRPQVFRLKQNLP